MQWLLDADHELRSRGCRPERQVGRKVLTQVMLLSTVFRYIWIVRINIGRYHQSREWEQLSERVRGPSSVVGRTLAEPGRI